MDLLIVGVWILCAFIAYNQAQKKGLNTGLWAFIGLVFGVFGVIASLIASPKKPSMSTGTINSIPPSSGGSSMLAGGAAGGAAGAATGMAATAGMTPAQQQAMSKFQEMAQDYVSEKNQEEESDFGDFDF